ncbi:MAG TPA: hypothetical protein VHL53_18500, partial [Acidimicrobiia bacterium]|nr:hypothetical protein [Acidimicrobiia bacterium]
PIPQNGGWAVGDAGWTLSAVPGGDTWSVSYYRSVPMASPATAPGAGSASAAVSRSAAAPAAADPAATTPGRSAAEVEARVRALLDGMGVPTSAWTFETTGTEVGIGWACASGPMMSPEEAGKLEADKLARMGGGAGSPGAAPSGTAPPAAGPTACPPPPPPVAGFNVAVFPVLDGTRADWPVWNVTLRSDGTIENLYGSWATFARAGNYRLRGVDAALRDLQTAPAIVPAAGAAVPAIAPVCAEPMPLPADAAASFAGGCPTPAPAVVTVTGVELGLLQAPVYENGKVRMDLVPAYRFTGHFDDGRPWSTSVVALHPDSIAVPPPNAPDGGTGAGDVPAAGRAEIPPAPPARPAGSATER